jgi:DNA helicase HerA-like ATPase
MKNKLIKDSILRVGEVSGIDGRKVYISLDKNKNASELFFDGKILKNIAVGSYVEIRKGFLSIIGKAEGEKLVDDYSTKNDNGNNYQIIDRNKRTLTIVLSGYINLVGRFIGGIKELPLIGNEAYILTDEKIHNIHNLLKEDTPLKINVAKTEIEEVTINFPIDGLFNSHIAIFGNTGSGKSNTLAILYQEMIKVLQTNNCLINSKFFIFDFNGEYVKDTCITSDKKVYNLSTNNDSGDKVPMTFSELMDIETLSILLEATEKTQKPFLKRTLNYFKKVKESTDDDGNSDYLRYFKNIVKSDIKNVLQMTNKDTAFKILDYIEEILGFFVDENTKQDLRGGIKFHETNKYFYLENNGNDYEHKFSDDYEKIYNTILYKETDGITENSLNSQNELNQFFIFLLLQLINDLYRYKVQVDHILPVINRFKAKQNSIEYIFEINDEINLWDNHSVVVMNLIKVNLDMRKTIPLLLAKNIYTTHKKEENKKTLSVIIDEAHNILSKTSFRETEDWKDYRLETFEEIIKEGRKFGVFVTIASQRPNDISETIISQAHNYFIHQLINQRDLLTIGNAVSYIDKITEESIPTLSVGTCIFSGIATPMPLKVRIDELPDNQKPDSNTIKFESFIEN